MNEQKCLALRHRHEVEPLTLSRSSTYSKLRYNKVFLPLVLNVAYISNSTISLLFAPYTVTLMPSRMLERVAGMTVPSWPRSTRNNVNAAYMMTEAIAYRAAFKCRANKSTSV